VAQISFTGSMYLPGVEHTLMLASTPEAPRPPTDSEIRDGGM
jgi:hypothetical protein